MNMVFYQGDVDLVNSPRPQFLPQRLGAIDIGSNAVRLAIADYQSMAEKEYHIIHKIRVPLRFGHDAFTTQNFTSVTIQKAIQTFKHFVALLDHYSVDHICAVATSAFREAKNTKEITRIIHEETGLWIQTIEGRLEADLVYQAVKKMVDIEDGASILMDLGGGSLEMSLVQNGELIAEKSFNLGTVRLLELSLHESPDKKVSQELEKFQSEFQEYFKQLPLDPSQKIKIVGTGGNFRRLGKLRKKILGKNDVGYLRPKELEEIYFKLKNYGPLKSSKKFDLDFDRAQVIVPAMQIIRLVTSLLPIDLIEVPNIGLVDGVFLQMTKGLQKGAFGEHHPLTSTSPRPSFKKSAKDHSERLYFHEVSWIKKPQ